MEKQEIVCIKGKIELPERFLITKEKRTLKIRTPYSSSFERLLKNDFQKQVIINFRQKGKDKPYIPEGFIEIDDVLFKVKEDKK